MPFKLRAYLLAKVTVYQRRAIIFWANSLTITVYKSTRLVIVLVNSEPDDNKFKKLLQYVLASPLCRPSSQE